MGTGPNVKTKVILALQPETTPDPLRGPVSALELLSTQAECNEAPACDQCWWDIHAVVRELWLDNSALGAVLPNEGTFWQLARPRSVLKHKVQWSVEHGGRALYFDFNGQRVAVAGTTIQTAAIAPIVNGQQPISESKYSDLVTRLNDPATGTSPIPANLQGIITVTLIETWAYQTVGPIGGREGRYTSRVAVPDVGVLPIVWVPPGATDVQITGTDALAWDFFDRAPTLGGTVVGRINTPLRESATRPVPGNAMFIQPIANPPASAIFSLSWITRF